MLGRNKVLVSVAVACGIGAIIEGINGESMLSAIILAGLVIALVILNGKLVIGAKLKDQEVEDKKRKFKMSRPQSCEKSKK